jgi:hypothetical protein
MKSDFEKKNREREIMNAKVDLTKTEAMITLAKNNDLACRVVISSLDVSICNNSKILPALEYHKQEIKKFLDGKENEWN